MYETYGVFELKSFSIAAAVLFQTHQFALDKMPFFQLLARYTLLFTVFLTKINISFNGIIFSFEKLKIIVENKIQ